MGIRVYNRSDRKLKPFGAKWVDNGKRRFQFFESEVERDAFISDFEKSVANHGPAIMQLSAAEAQIMVECIERLGSATAVLRAVDAYAGRRDVTQITVTKATQEYINEKINAGFDEDYIRHLRSTLLKFSAAFPGRVMAVTPSDARRWTIQLPHSAVTVFYHIKILRSFFNWLVERGYAGENIFKAVQAPKIHESEPEFLRVDQMRALLTTAQTYYPDAVVYFAMGAFAGIRSSACTRLDLKRHIRFDQQGILITGDIAKNARRQFIDGYEQNLWDWLTWATEFAPAGFDLPARRWEFRRGQVAKKAGVWMPKNALRHSFCTYHCALHGDAGKTATLLNHRGNVSVLYQHYKGNAAAGDAQDYFAICPQ